MKNLPQLRARYLLVLTIVGLIGFLTNHLAQGSGESTNNLAALTTTFNYIEIDSTIGGDIKLVGDIDGDSFPDLVMGGYQSERLNWYRYPNWDKYVIHTPDVEFTTDGALGDIDGDGDLDIAVPDGNSGDNLRWFENPRPTGDPAVGSQWVEHTIGSIGNWGKDVYVADYDSDGRLDVATRQQLSAMIFFQTGDDVWTKMTFSGLNLGNEGMTSGRVDSDANEDLVLRGTWVRNPGGSAARTASNWTQYTIGAANSDFKALVVDLNQNGVIDVLFSSSENTDEVVWYEPTTGNPTGSWTKHVIVSSLERAHTLQAADMDLDGDLDVVLAQMHTSTAKELMIMENLDGSATSWQKQVIDNTGLHNGKVADIGNDGDYDIFGANWAGNPPVKLYVNELDSGGTLDAWSYKEVTNSHEQTFGLTFGDVNGDGPVDIISGHYWYRNPGGDMFGSWVQNTLPSGMHAFLVEDVDGDARIDVIAQQSGITDLALYWLEAADAGGTSWDTVQIGSVPIASHNLGAQGYRSGQIEAGGRPEIAISSGQGVYYFRIPASPESGNWPRVQINSNPSDEGFALGDIDRDSRLDVAATTGDSKRVEWYRNPGTGGSNWTAYHIGDFQEALYPDRTEIADINDDNLLDIIVTEENGGDTGAETYWWEAPSNPTNTSWARHPIVSQATTNSMDTADMDADGDTDIILGEHRGSERVTIWENIGGGNLTEHLVGSGHESHLGAQSVDLDNDGDLDIVSIAYDNWQYIHLWRNDATSGGPSPTTTPLPTATATNTPVPPTNTPNPSQTNTPGPTNTATATPSCSPTPGTGRVVNGQQVLYLFNEGSGSIVGDSAGVGSPINLSIENSSAVSWLPGGGLIVNSPTIIKSGSPPTRLFNDLIGSNGLTLEVWVAPDNLQQTGPVRILTMSSDAYNRNFTMGQEFDAYEMRLRTTATTYNGFPPIPAPSGSATTNLTHLVFTWQTNGQANIYVNDTLVVSDTRSGDLSNWDNSFLLALGNELNGDRAWLGTFYLVAIYDRSLSTAEIDQNFQAGPNPVTSSGLGNCDPTPTATNIPLPTATNTPLPTATNTPQPSATATNSPLPSATNTPQPSATDTATSVPPTNTAVPTATNTPVPTATVACIPTRVTAGQQVLYLFDEGSGSIVGDSAGVGVPIDLNIGDSSAVSWLPDGGLEVNSPTIIESGSPPIRLMDAVMENNEITLEAWVIPANLEQTGPGRILTLSKNPQFRDFTMGQELDAYEMRIRTTATTNNGFPRIFGPTGSATTGLTHIVLTRQTSGDVSLYVNNNMVISAFRGGDLSNWNEQFGMAIANELTENRPWLGTYHLVSVYDRALDSAEIAQNFEAGPQPGQEPGGCSGITAGASNSKNDDNTSSPISLLFGLFATVLMGGLSARGLNGPRIRGIIRLEAQERHAYNPQGRFQLRASRLPRPSGYYARLNHRRCRRHCCGC